MQFVAVDVFGFFSGHGAQKDFKSLGGAATRLLNNFQKEANTSFQNRLKNVGKRKKMCDLVWCIFAKIIWIHSRYIIIACNYTENFRFPRMHVLIMYSSQLVNYF